MPRARTCDACDDEYTFDRSTSRYCSDACRVWAHRQTRAARRDNIPVDDLARVLRMAEQCPCESTVPHRIVAVIHECHPVARIFD